MPSDQAADDSELQLETNQSDSDLSAALREPQYSDQSLRAPPPTALSFLGERMMEGKKKPAILKLFAESPLSQTSTFVMSSIKVCGLY